MIDVFVCLPYMYCNCVYIAITNIRLVLHNVSFLSSMRYPLFQIRFWIELVLREHPKNTTKDSSDLTKNYHFCINFIKILFKILKIKPIFGDFFI